VSSDSSPQTPGEFRPYRRFVSLFILTFVTLGSIYMLVSVGVTIYRRTNAVPTGSPVGAIASEGEIEGCYEELTDVADGLEKHLENFHHLFSHYDVAEAQRWAEDQSFWLGQWKAAGRRCHFQERRVGRFAKEWEHLGVVHADLRETEAAYTRDLLHFGQDQAPRLDRIRKSLDEIGARLSEGPKIHTEARSEARSDTPSEPPTDSQDRGDASNDRERDAD
jgi:hypothetical protein